MIDWLRVSPQMLLNFLNTNIGTFVAEVLLFAILVPTYLAYAENRKWRTMRKELYFCFYDMLNGAHPLLMDALKMDGTQFDKASYVRLYDNLKSKVMILGACIDSSISSNVTVILRSLDAIELYFPALQKAHSDLIDGVITRGEMSNRWIAVTAALSSIESNFKQLRIKTGAVGRAQSDVNAPRPEDYDRRFSKVRERIAAIETA